ncbi:MAG: hypothetical protein ACM3UR_13275 [Bacteroidota bacterium]
MDALIKKVQYEIPGANPNEKFTDEKTVIAIVTTKPSEVSDVAFRAFDIRKDAEGKVTKNDVVFFGSTRGGQVIPTPDGYQVDVPENLNLEGKEFELKEIASKKVIAAGKIFKAPVVDAEQSDPDPLEAKPKARKEKTL